MWLIAVAIGVGLSKGFVPDSISWATTPSA